MPGGPRRRRARLCAGVYRALFGTTDGTDEETKAESETEPSETREEPDGTEVP